jgi:hypothetical protein
VFQHLIWRTLQGFIEALEKGMEDCCFVNHSPRIPGLRDRAGTEAPTPGALSHKASRHFSASVAESGSPGPGKAIALSAFAECCI